MPRKRTIPDEDLLDAALELVHQEGPEALTFGALAARTGLAGSTLVQRFGSRRALLRAALVRAWDQLDRRTAKADAAAGEGRDGVIELLVTLTGGYPDTATDEFADQLLVLREDLRDPVLRARGEAWIAELVAAIDRRLAGAPVGPLVVAHWQGLVTVWAFTRPAPLVTFVAESLDELLTRLDRVASGVRPRM